MTTIHPSSSDATTDWPSSSSSLNGSSCSLAAYGSRRSPAWNWRRALASLRSVAGRAGEGVQRARRLVPRERVCAIVALQHERHWRGLLRSLPARNVIIQPRNCGTANGVLLGLLRILERDPLAHIMFLPADHYVHNELSLADSIRTPAMFARDRDRHRFTLSARPSGGRVLGRTSPAG